MQPTLNRRSAMMLGAVSVLLAPTALTQQSRREDAGMTASTAAVCNAYLDAWARKDVAGIAGQLHPQVHFKGPMQELDGKDSVLAATQRILPLLVRFDVRTKFFSGNSAVFVYDFVCHEPIGVCRTAELVHCEDGLIRSTELFFDARPFEAMQRAQAQRPAS